MARPCKSVNTMSKNLTKKEKENRLEVEQKLKGNADKIKPPSSLTKEQKKIFKFIVDELKASEILGNPDIFLLEKCAISIDFIKFINEKLNKNKEILTENESSNLRKWKETFDKDFFRCCNELCLSPQSRAKLSNINLQAKQHKEDPLLKALRGEDID